MYWYIPVRTGIYWFVLVCTSTYQHVLHIFPTHKSCWNIRIQTGTCQDVHSGTLSYCLVSSCPLLDTRWYKAVQGSEIGTRRYKAVPKIPVPLNSAVQGSSWWYKALYRLVPHYSGVQDFWVLPCTAWCRLVSRRGQGCMRENQNLRNMLVCTSTYLYILVRTDSYQSCKSMYWFILLRILINQYVQVHTSTDKYIPAHTGTYQYIPVYTDLYWYVLVHSRNSWIQKSCKQGSNPWSSAYLSYALPLHC